MELAYLVTRSSIVIKIYFIDKALHAIEELEGHLEELDIQPMPEAQYVVYNRVPKVQIIYTQIHP